jgi:hypothetical protein
MTKFLLQRTILRNLKASLRSEFGGVERRRNRKAEGQQPEERYHIRMTAMLELVRAGWGQSRSA